MRLIRWSLLVFVILSIAQIEAKRSNSVVSFTSIPERYLVDSLNQVFCVLFLQYFVKVREFRIDYQNNQFSKDGEPFRFIAGSFHYFRALPETWQQKLRTMRAAGLNAVTTYVEWSLHNPKPDIYNWNGIGDLDRFIRLAAEEDLLVILRPGPYICAERDMVQNELY